MGAIAAHKTISEIAKQVLVMQENYNQSDLERLVQIGIQGYTDMHVYDLPIINQKILKLSEANSVNLPNDFIREIRVMGKFGNQLTPLKENKVNTFSQEECGDERPPFQQERDLYLSKSRMAENIGGNYASSGDFSYQYTIDYKRSKIFFNKKTPGSVVYLEYIGSGVSDNGDTYVPLLAVTPLRDYIIWQKDILNPVVGENRVQSRKKNFEDSQHKMRHAYSLITYEQYLDEFWGSTSQSVKR